MLLPVLIIAALLQIAVIVEAVSIRAPITNRVPIASSRQSTTMNGRRVALHSRTLYERRRLPVPVKAMNIGNPPDEVPHDDGESETEDEVNSFFENDEFFSGKPSDESKIPDFPCHLVKQQLESYTEINIRSFNSSLLSPMILECIQMEFSGDLLGLTRQLMRDENAEVHDIGAVYRMLERAAAAGKFHLVRTVLESPTAVRRLNRDFLRPTLIQAVRNRNFITAHDLVQFGVPFDEYCQVVKHDFDLAVDLYLHFVVSYQQALACYRLLEYDETVPRKWELGMELRDNPRVKPLPIENSKQAFRDYIHHSTQLCPVAFAADSGDVRLLQWLLARKQLPIQSPGIAQRLTNGLQTVFKSQRPNQRVKSAMANLVGLFGLPADSLSLPAVILAIEKRHNDVLELLLEAMQSTKSPLMQVHEIQQALELAVRYGNEPAISLLRQYIDGNGQITDSVLKRFRSALHLDRPEDGIAELLEEKLTLPPFYYTDIATHIRYPKKIMRVLETLLFHSQLPSLQDGFGALKVLAGRGLPYVNVMRFIHSNIAGGEAKRLDPADYEAIVGAALDAEHSDLLAEIVPQFERIGNLNVMRVLENRARAGKMAGIKFLLQYCGIKDVSQSRILRGLPPPTQLDLLRALMETNFAIPTNTERLPVGCDDQGAQLLERCLQLNIDNGGGGNSGDEGMMKA